MRLALLADGDVGLKILEYLLDRFPSDIAMVVATKNNEISELSSKHGVATFIYEEQEQEKLALELSERAISLGVMAWWPFILPASIITKPTNGFVNTHPSLLPHNRGKHFSFWALVEQAPFGVSLHFVTTQIDAGDVIAQQRIPYDWSDTGGSLYAQAKTQMIELFRSTYPSLRSGSISAHQQELSAGSFHRSDEISEASEIKLDEHYSARSLLNLLRAKMFDGKAGCTFTEDGIKYEVFVTISASDDTD